MKPACRSRSVRIGGSTVAQTPLPLPAFSSKALKSNLADTAKRIGEIVFGPILISAFDLHGGHLVGVEQGKLVFDCPLTFIDSGGYENLLHVDHPDKRLTVEQHRAVLDAWPQQSLAVAVNHDRPSDDVAEQIEAAASLGPGRMLGRELLLKPSENVSVSGLISQLSRQSKDLARIDVIGLTEKEAGPSLVDLLRTIASLRKQLDTTGFDYMPIHIFGGLDPVRTPLYFLAGADIFDGLSWLRYGFEAGCAVYLSALAALKHPRVPLVDAEWLVRQSNFFEITKMQTAMRKYMATQDPKDLHESGNFFLSILNDIDV